MKKNSVLLLIILSVLSLVACTGSPNDAHTTITNGVGGADNTSTTTIKSAAVLPSINGISLSEYVVVYSEMAPDYTERAATYIRDQIKERTGASLPLLTTEQQTTPAKHEIVVGETDRAVSKSLDAKTEGMEFTLLSKDGHIAIEGDYFIIAAAAYYFIETYVTNEVAQTTVPDKATVCKPITEEPRHFFLLIGDGMGPLQTQLFSKYSTHGINFSDDENQFYGYLFPYHGEARTASLSGITDSAASGTALATGSKTTNGRIGRDRDNKDLLSLTELAASLGMATAVMSTEGSTGATPAAFSAHANDRSETEDILENQNKLKLELGTIIHCDEYNYYLTSFLKNLENAVTESMNTLYRNEKGSFMMYEEAYIDKHCHNGDLINTFRALVRFNQIIGLVMEKAFYNPDTFVLITADHETGDMQLTDGNFSYTSSGHTSTQVPVFVYGQGADVFDDQVIENVQIPKTIAAMWGESLMQSTDDTYPPLR